ncbi:MAG TPA: START domain-containing protein [Bacteroidales bacterium]|nr:START domain-containing protein [Bacteroidales bacterium]
MALILQTGEIRAQEWELARNKNGVVIYTRKEKGKQVKSFRGITDVRAPVEKVYNLIGNVKNVDWWDKNLKEIRVLSYEKDKHSQYYLVYDAPWPVTDRDLCVDATITTDPVTGVRKVVSVPLLNVVPLNPNYVRITEYFQTWLIEPNGKGVVHLVLEGHVNPAGSVPDWVYNMVIADTPLKIMSGIKELLEKK